MHPVLQFMVRALDTQSGGLSRPHAIVRHQNFMQRRFTLAVDTIFGVNP